MSGSVHKVILLGRLGKDPEVKYTQGGAAVGRFSLATDESWKDQSGEKQQRTGWHNVVAWRKLAEICCQYLTKTGLCRGQAAEPKLGEGLREAHGHGSCRGSGRDAGRKEWRGGEHESLTDPEAGRGLRNYG
jgi:hypothetical protein